MATSEVNTTLKKRHLINNAGTALLDISCKFAGSIYIYNFHSLSLVRFKTTIIVQQLLHLYSCIHVQMVSQALLDDEVLVIVMNVLFTKNSLR